MRKYRSQAYNDEYQVYYLESRLEARTNDWNKTRVVLLPGTLIEVIGTLPNQRKAIRIAGNPIQYIVETDDLAMAI